MSVGLVRPGLFELVWSGASVTLDLCVRRISDTRPLSDIRERVSDSMPQAPPTAVQVPWREPPWFFTQTTPLLAFPPGATADGPTLTKIPVDRCITGSGGAANKPPLSVT